MENKFKKILAHIVLIPFYAFFIAAFVIISPFLIAHWAFETVFSEELK